MSKAIDDVVNERTRQKHVEQWSTKHDDSHTDGSLAAAGACYALFASCSDSTREADCHGREDVLHFPLIRLLWPRSWSMEWWKPKDRRRDLVRAAALLIAEIERLDRL